MYIKRAPCAAAGFSNRSSYIDRSSYMLQTNWKTERHFSSKGKGGEFRNYVKREILGHAAELFRSCPEKN